MVEKSPNQQDWREAAKKLRGARLWSRISLFCERLAPAILPLSVVIGLFFVVSWFGLFRSVGDLTRIFIGLVFTLAALGSLASLRKFVMPTGDEIDRRLERDNKLMHQPITAQDDRLAVGDDEFANTLWKLHQKKLAGQISDVQGVKARTNIPERDPWAARALVPLLLVIAFAYSFGSKGGRIGDVFFSHVQEDVVAARIDAWVTPPSYTGVAPIFMTSDINAERRNFTAPKGSKIVVRVSGGTGAEQVTFPDTATIVDLLEDNSGRNASSARQFEVVAMQSGELSILPQAVSAENSLSSDDSLQQWSVTISPDNAPEVAFDGDVERAVNGAMTLNYTAKDDYRIASGEALARLADEQADDARPLYDAPDIALRLPRRNDEDKAKTSIDLTEHPWAGARVNLQLRVEDDLGQTGTSETIETVLPGKPFSNKLARALIEQRRNLALDANSSLAVYDMLDLFTLYPEETINNTAHFLGITTAKSKLRYAENDDELRAVVDYLWEVARNIEDGGLSDAERRLKDAQQALREALENGASDEEIEQAMNELREAMQEYLQEFARQNQNNPQNQQQDQNAQQLDPQSLDEMLDRLEEMAKSGAREQAMDMLSQLQDMMNNLQMGQQQQGQQGQQNQAQQQMNELGEILREQQELMNDTFRRSQRPEDGGQEGEQGQGEQQQGQNGGQQGQQQPGQGQQPGEQGQQGQQGQNGQQQGQGEQGIEGLAPGQQALQDRLNQFMQELEGMGINPGDAFSDAERSMGDAGDALGEGSGDQALSDQGEAMDSLRSGAESMMQQMEQQAQQGQGSSSEPGGNRNAGDRDPLGRPQRSSGPDFGDDVDVPDEIDVRRAREILEAIRKRLGDGALQQLEKDYLERLLDLN